jgi:hypothetical protein
MYSITVGIFSSPDAWNNKNVKTTTVFVVEVPHPLSTEAKK